MQLLLNGALLLSGGAIIDLDATIVFQLVTFFLVYLVLRATVFGPMLKLFEARETAIDGAKHKARELESDAEEQLRDFEAKVKAAKVEAAAERDRLRQDGQQLERELVARARTEADKTLEDASRRMGEEASAVRAHMKDSVPQMASQIAEKLLGRKAS